MKTLYNQLLKNKGFTVDSEMKAINEKGYFVSLPRTETRIPLTIFTFELMTQLVNEYRKNTHLIGAWIENSIVYFDNSILINNLQTAINLALEYNQIAIYDNEAKQSIFLIDAIGKKEG